MARWMVTRGVTEIPSDRAHCLLPCGMNHNLWKVLVSHKEAAALIRAIGKMECDITATFVTVLHRAVSPAVKGPRWEHSWQPNT